MKPIVLITGGSRGIGAATAKNLAQQGYRVCINYRSNEDAANKLVADIKKTVVKPSQYKPT
jgi:NAD(P)-dependent dehydrogenase (short-subunit alcohol dehydrogenase family)